MTQTSTSPRAKAALHIKILLASYPVEVHVVEMDGDPTHAPAFWVEELALSEVEVARGERVPANDIHAELKAVLADLDSGLEEDISGPAPIIDGR